MKVINGTANKREMSATRPMASIVVNPKIFDTHASFFGKMLIANLTQVLNGTLPPPKNPQSAFY